jgi:nucleoside-diphosphate-sugar epimerase
MRVLVVGASGAIGKFLVPRLISARHTVIGVTRTAGSMGGTKAQEIVADLTDRDSFLAAVAGMKVDAVVHQATALRKPPISRRDMRATNRLRAEGTSTLVAAARQLGAKKFVAASFFGGYGFSDHGRQPLTESASFGQPDGRNDAVLAALDSLELQTLAFGGIALRYGLFYGAGSTISPVARHWRGAVPMVHLSDAASAVVAALSKGKAGSVYNIADGHPISYRDREVARARALGVRPPIELPEALLRTVAPFAGELLTRTSMRLSIEKAQTELRWAPKESLVE